MGLPAWLVLERTAGDVEDSPDTGLEKSCAYARRGAVPTYSGAPLMGLVQGFGRVIPGEDGWRAEKQPRHPGGDPADP